MPLKLVAFILLLMGFDGGGGGMVKHYWMICEHKMLDYCGISKYLAS
jgi:hypothetical protein